MSMPKPFPHQGLTITQAEAEHWLPKSLQDNYEPARAIETAFA